MLKLGNGFILMRRFASMTRQNCTRWIFIFSVLAGLFFSGGEGIQLLPFPIAEDNNSKNTSSTLETNLKSYAFSVHNSANHSTLLKSKFQKHANQYLAGGYFLPDWSNVHANFCLQSAHNREETDFSHISLVLSSQSDRAPPTV
jgi:hypothetical protein